MALKFPIGERVKFRGMPADRSEGPFDFSKLLPGDEGTVVAYDVGGGVLVNWVTGDQAEQSCFVKEDDLEAASAD